MGQQVNFERYPNNTEVIYTIKKLIAFFLSSVFLNGLGVATFFLFSGKWNWYPAFMLVCASLIVTILSITISFYAKRALTIYRIYIICLFVCDLPLVYTLFTLLISRNLIWGSIFTVLLAALLLFLTPVDLNKHANNFKNALTENQAIGVFNPKTNVWRVSVPIIRKSQEQDRKGSFLSKAAVPTMYAIAVYLNKLLGKLNIFLIIFLLILFIYFAYNELLFYLNIHKQISDMELQSGKKILLPYSKEK